MDHARPFSVSSLTRCFAFAPLVSQRSLIAALVALLATLSLPGQVRAAPCWTPPVVGTVIDEFRAPQCPYCPGNRGLEYATVAGQSVRAVASGQVVWSGAIAHVRWVVVRHTDGLRVTYGRLATANVSQGDLVVRGTVLGTTGDRFYLGVRVDEEYVDPAPMLGRLVGRARLIPTDGGPARPAPPPLLRCGR